MAQTQHAGDARVHCLHQIGQGRRGIGGKAGDAVQIFGAAHKRFFGSSQAHVCPNARKDTQVCGECASAP